MKKIKFVLVSLFSLVPTISSCNLLISDDYNSKEENKEQEKTDDSGEKENTSNEEKEGTNDDSKQDDSQQDEQKQNDPTEEEPKQDDPKPIDPQTDDPKPIDPGGDNPGTDPSSDNPGTDPSSDNPGTDPSSDNPGSSGKLVDIDTLKKDKRYLTSKGVGYTYLDYYLNVKFKPWDKLIEDKNITFRSIYFDGNNLDTLGKGILHFPSELDGINLSGGTDNFVFNNELLDGVIIPGDINVKSLSSSLFSGNKSIRTVEFLAPSNSSSAKFKTIGSKAFQNCEALESVKFSNSNIEEISYYAFSNCTSLKSIDLSNLSNLKTIETQTFYKCTSLTTITLSNSLSEIPIECFKECTSLKELTFSSSKELILGSSAFESCGLTKLTINSPIRIKGSYTFNDNTNLTNISFGANGKVIFDETYGSFSNCTGIKNLDFSKVEFSGKSTSLFENCGFTSIDLSNSNFSELPGSIFINCPNLTTVTFSSKIKTIGERAFYNCFSLTSINGLETSGIKLGDFCFNNCVKLNSMNSSSTLSFADVSLGKAVFEKTAFTSISVTNNITNYDGSWMDGSFQAFSNMEQLTSASIKLTNSYILSGYMFYNCKNLKTIDIEVPYDTSLVNTTNKTDQNKFESASEYPSFDNCTSLTTINFSGTVDQLMHYYCITKYYEDLDIPFKLKDNNQIKINCKKGCVKDNVTTSITLNSTNFKEYCTKFKTPWADTI